MNRNLLHKLADNWRIDVHTTSSDTMNYPPYGGQGGYQPAPAGGYPQTGQQGFPVPVCIPESRYCNNVTEFSVHIEALYSV